MCYRPRRGKGCWLISIYMARIGWVDRPGDTFSSCHFQELRSDKRRVRCSWWSCILILSARLVVLLVTGEDLTVIREFESSGENVALWDILARNRGFERYVANKKPLINFCVSMHHYIWVYWDQLDANCLVLFYYTFCSTCFGCNTHPSIRSVI